MSRQRIDAFSLRPRLVTLDQAKGRVYPAGRMLVSSPAAIGAIVACIPYAFVLRMGDLRAALAAAYDADYTCPMTTGMFLRMLAESIEMARTNDSPPWWRVVRDDGRLLDTLPGGDGAQRRMLESEGHVFLPSKTTRLGDVTTTAWTATDIAMRAARAAGA